MKNDKKHLAWLTNNLPLKIISVVIAIVIWYVVVYYNDPVETKGFSVPVAVDNTSYIANGKQTFYIDDQFKTVTVYVQANHSVLKNLNASDITVVADLTQIIDFDRDPIMVPLTVSCDRVSYSALSLSRNAIPITIENIASQEFQVVVDVGSSTPGDAYEVGALTANPERITLSGPQSVISQIDRVVARIDVSGMTQDGLKSATLKIMDKYNNELSETMVKDNLTFVGGYSSVDVYVDLWRKRSGVGFTVEYSGEPAFGYQVSGITTTPETVTVVGDDAALQALASAGNKITIPGDRVDITNALTDTTVTVTLTDLLEGNLRLASNMADSISVQVMILPNGSREFSLDVDTIELTGLLSSRTVSFDQSELEFRVQANDRLLEQFYPYMARAEINFTGYNVAGDYILPVNITLPAGYSLVEEVTISLHVKEKVTPTPTPTGTPQPSVTPSGGTNGSIETQP